MLYEYDCSKNYDNVIGSLIPALLPKCTTNEMIHIKLRRSLTNNSDIVRHPSVVVVRVMHKLQLPWQRQH
jgi:hypothetical protein